MNATSPRSKEEYLHRTTERASLSIIEFLRRSSLAGNQGLRHYPLHLGLFDVPRDTPSPPAPIDRGVPRQVAQNDIVVLTGDRGTWKVVASVNGTKADIRRRATFDTRIVTVSVANLTVLRRAGSPECDY